MSEPARYTVRFANGMMRTLRAQTRDEAIAKAQRAGLEVVNCTREPESEWTPEALEALRRVLQQDGERHD